MIFALPAIFFFLLVYGPFLWVKYILWKFNKPIESMPGTGYELANHFIEKFELDGVKVVKGKPEENHYDPSERVVCLSPDVFDGKSLTSVAVATHEIGHAIQFAKNEPVTRLRGKYLNKAQTTKNIGIFILMSIPLIGLIFRIPHLAFLTAAVGITTMLVSVLMYVAVLPEEYDASFKKALPILEEGYVPKENLPAIRQILRACAYTYVAGALADIIRLWRWLALKR